MAASSISSSDLNTGLGSGLGRGAGSARLRLIFAPSESFSHSSVMRSPSRFREAACASLYVPTASCSQRRLPPKV